MAKKAAPSPVRYVRMALEEIAEWELPKKRGLASLGDFALHPAANITAKMIPSQIQSAGSFAIEKALLLAAQAGGISVDAAAVARDRKRSLGRKRLLGSRLLACDTLAKRVCSFHWKYAAAQGAATGLAGFSGLLADIPLLLSIAIREIRMISLCYGYGERTPGEIDYALHILRLGASSESAVKKQSHLMLKHLEEQLRLPHVSHGQEADGVKFLVSIQQYAKSLAYDLLRRNVLQLIPLAGVVAGASSNAAFAQDVGRAAYMCYRRRYINEGLRQ